ncbi:MAG: creatininase family protein [Alphaproteobacteria bacterium]|nr:creatininase family protein [Alphaproteobacteria bacterium]
MKYLFLSLLLTAVNIGIAASPALAQNSAENSQSQAAKVQPPVWIEEMTWTEIDGALKLGYTNIIIPAAGIEQNGPHIPLYKHRLVVRNNAEKIARILGKTLIAPVIDFVPEGNIESREGHMNFAGTISMPAKVFGDIIDYTVRSLSQHGFRQFYIIGDSGSSQQAQEQIAKSLRKNDYEAFHIGDYYANKAQEEFLGKHGFDEKSIGGHSGLRDTSEFMLVAPMEVRSKLLGVVPKDKLYQYGTWGNTAKANPQIGHMLSQIKVQAAVKQICEDTNIKSKACHTR